MRASAAPLIVALILFSTLTLAGPFEQDGIQKDDPNILGWASGYLNYLPAGEVGSSWSHPERALGPAAGSHVDVVSLGEPLDGSGDPPGCITLTFDWPLADGAGADLAVYENGFFNGDLLFADLGYVEVSSDGESFTRFPSVSLTAEPVGNYGCIDPTDVYGLAGRHPNAYGEFHGTLFDLAELNDDPLVEQGEVDLAQIEYVRIVDAPGSGAYFDNATELGYAGDHPIYDVYPTLDSSGFDLEALAVLHYAAGYQPDDDDDDQTDDDDSDDDQDDDGAAGDDDNRAPDGARGSESNGSGVCGL